MDRYLTTGDVARALGVTINTVKAWIRRGQVEAIRLPSGHYRIPATELERFRGNASHDMPARYRERRRQWGVAESWSRSQPLREVPFEEALAWASRMLTEAQSHGEIPEPSIEGTIERRRVMLRALSLVRP